MGGRFQMVFAAFVLAMWIITGIWVNRGIWSLTNSLMLTAAAILCLLVFVVFEWVFSYSYALTAIVLPLVILAREGLSTGALLLASISVVYGVRLFVYRIQRSRRARSTATEKGIASTNDGMPLAPKIILFVCCTWLMAFLSMTTYLLASRHITNVGVCVGAAIMAIGLLLEGAADWQKQRAKAVDSGRWVDTGLYARTRNPHYAGEILVQLGVVVAALSAGVAGLTWYETTAGLLSPVYIVLLMLWSAGAADRRKLANYGDDPAYQSYLRATASLIPASQANSVGAGPAR